MIDEREKARRRAAFEDGIHSAYLDGGMVTEAFRADAEEYINGIIDLDELRAVPAKVLADMLDFSVATFENYARLAGGTRGDYPALRTR